MISHYWSTLCSNSDQHKRSCLKSPGYNRHHRGHSQQHTNAYFLKQKPEPRVPALDNRYYQVSSSEHSRPAALASKQSAMPRGKKDRLNKFKQRSRQKKKSYLQMPKATDMMREDCLPYSPKQILKLFSHLLSTYQREEIKDFKSIYYIGTNWKSDRPLHADETQRRPDQFLTPNNSFYQYEVGDHLAYRYEILSSINKGAFGEVLKVFDYKTKQIQAVKIVRRSQELIKQTFIEISILSAIREKDSEDMSGIVRIKDFTIFRDHICIFLELLESNLYELMHANDFQGFEESFVRVLAIQILNSLNFLHRHRIVHCDIKLENVVLKVWGKSGIKVVDFGTSCYETEQIYTYIQSRYYRAPEIIFDFRQYTCSIDLWSFAVLVAELSLGKPLFPGSNNLHQLYYMVAMMGIPNDPIYLSQISSCHKELEVLRSKNYFEKQGGHIPEHRVKQFEADTGLTIDRQCIAPFTQRLGEKQLLMLHFLNQILKWNPKQRMSPAEALQHPWVLAGLPTQMKELHCIYENLQISKNKRRGRKRKSNFQGIVLKKKTGSRKKNRSDGSKSQSKSQKHVEIGDGGTKNTKGWDNLTPSGFGKLRVMSPNIRNYHSCSCRVEPTLLPMNQQQIGVCKAKKLKKEK